MSLVRLLLHSDQYNITGIVASTSYWLNGTVRPEAILNTTSVWNQVIDNLNVHSAGHFPTKGYLESIVKAGHPVYGTAVFNQTTLSFGAKHLIDVVDGLPKGDILHVQGWGGVQTLAEALKHVRSTRRPRETDDFVRHIRLYTISDQDNAGPWIRLNFPSIPYIVSIHAFNTYGEAAWIGMNGGAGSDTNLTSQSYATENFQIGPLGPYYPDIKYSMEGDTPTLLHTLVNGVNGAPEDHPEWGGWGGRYGLVDPSRQTMVYANTQDSVVGIDNKTYTTSQATIWRWRQAYQDEMSARVQWTLLSDYAAGSHPPVVSVNGSCGSDHIEFEVDPEQTITLDGSATYDSDEGLAGHGDLEYKWWQYKEVTSTMGTSAGSIPTLNFTLSDGGRVASVRLPTAEAACPPVEAVQNEGLGIQKSCHEYHIILEVKGSGTPPIWRYKRTILKVQSPIAG
ncbi:putative immunoglobulin-like, ribonucleoside hydrolase [Septoria linicola]|nr:putative immunoglobulin-like, ribonucleoside hydrolase [Septoria linicola]